MSKEERLSIEIRMLSESKDWEEAKTEWELESIYFSEDSEICLCGHTPIIECCVLRNTINENTAVVGNVCVNKFIGIETDPIFDAVKRVKSDYRKALNVKTLEYAISRKWINNWEMDFYSDTIKKRKLTEKQRTKRIQINEKIIRKIFEEN
jgi:hypothetical protein